MALAPNPTKPRFNETTTAILVAAAISVVLATLMVGNPFRALRLAYLDYSHTTAAPGVAPAGTTRAPTPQ